jgi:aspartyl-tRNA(Asn)/glutamyl-tRNA(Gln) amidotransferase subunit B
MGFCQQAIQALPREAELVRKGNDKVVMKMIGYVMKISGGRVDAKAVGKTLKEALTKKIE